MKDEKIVASSWAQIRRLMLYARPHWKGGMLSLLALCLNAGMVAAFWYAIDRLIKPIVQSKQSEMTALIHAGLLLAVISLGGFISGVLHIFLSNRVTQRVVKDLRIDLFSHLHNLSISYLENRKTGELMSRVTYDIWNLQSIMVSHIIAGIRAAIVLIALFGIMIYRSWHLTLITAVGLPVIAFTLYKASRGIRRISEQIYAGMADVSAALQESISLMRVVQAFAMEEREVQRFRDLNQSVYKRIMRSIRIQALLSPFIEFTGVCGIIVAMMAGGLFIFHGLLTPAGLISFMLVVPQAANQFKILSGLQMAFEQCASAIERVFEVLDTEPEIREKPNAMALPRLRGEVEFDRVCFSYSSSGEVLRDVSFYIKPGQVVALVGASGAGKTTIANLLLRLYDVTRGAVRVDGDDIRDVTLHSLRRQIAIVPQDTMLFSGTVRDNIAFARPEASDEEIRAAAQSANADGFIQTLSAGYNTAIGERGVKLSGGQRQRIAIARAVLRDPRILILDEATSSLDAESEALVQEALQRLMQNRTTIIIAHRFSTIQRADRILVLDRGRIVEEGTHPELFAARGLYRQLYDFQTLTETEAQRIGTHPTPPSP